MNLVRNACNLFMFCLSLACASCSQTVTRVNVSRDCGHTEWYHSEGKPDGKTTKAELIERMECKDISV